MLEKVQRLRQFIFVDLWREIPTPSRIRAAVIHVVRISILAGRDFVADKCGMRATALSYVTLLSIVPLLAFAFAVMKGFEVQDRLESVLGRVTAGQKEVLKGILDYVARTNVKALGTIGLVFLIWTIIKTLGTIEKSFNDIWGVQQSRSMFRKFTDYVSVLVTAPILLIAAMSATGFLQSDFFARSQWLGLASRAVIRLLPYAGTWIAFSAVYMFMPNTSVRVTPALTGGIVAGTIWQLAFWVYTVFQVGMAKYNAIYGTFAALPIFMVWLYVSWAIVLFGAEVSWAMQNVGRYWEQRRAAAASFATREAIALRAMISLAVAFTRDGKPLSIEDLTSRLKAPPRLIRDVLHSLVGAGLCSQVVAGEGTAYQPGRSLGTMTPADILAALRTQGEALELSTEGGEAAVVAELLQAAGATTDRDLRAATLRDIATRLAREQPAPSSAPAPTES